MCVCLYVMHVCVCEDNLGYCFSDPPTFLFKTGSLTALELAKQVRLSIREAPGTCQPPPLQQWDYINQQVGFFSVWVLGITLRSLGWPSSQPPKYVVFVKTKPSFSPCLWWGNQTQGLELAGKVVYHSPMVSWSHESRNLTRAISNPSKNKSR